MKTLKTYYFKKNSSIQRRNETKLKYKKTQKIIIEQYNKTTKHQNTKKLTSL
jgi:hypothetical protein